MYLSHRARRNIARVTLTVALYGFVVGQIVVVALQHHGVNICHRHTANVGNDIVCDNVPCIAQCISVPLLTRAINIA